MSDSSVLDGDAKSVASRLFGLSEDSHWYNIHAAVHRLDVGSVFAVRFMAIPGQPIISCEVPPKMAIPNASFLRLLWS